MKKGKSFKDFPEWGVYPVEIDNFSMSRVLTYLVRARRWRSASVFFKGRPRETLYIMPENVKLEPSEFFNQVGELNLDDIDCIVLYTGAYGYKVIFDHEHSKCWTLEIQKIEQGEELTLWDIEKDFYKNRRNRTLISTNYGRKNQFLEEDKNKLQISANYGKKIF